MRGCREGVRGLDKERFLSVSQGSLPEFKEIHEPCFDVCTGQLNWAGVICHRILSLLTVGKQVWVGLDNGNHCLWIKMEIISRTITIVSILFCYC